MPLQRLLPPPADIPTTPLLRRWARATALEAGVTAVHDLSGLDEGADLVIDAVFGLGLSRPVTGVALDALRWLQACPAPTLCVDLPSGLDADSGRWWADAPPHACGPRVTLALLTLKPGLFTGVGRACVGSALWFDDLGVTATEAPDAWLAWDDAWPQVPTLRADHASHKGQRGDVLIIGGQLPTTGDGIGMTGAALLAGRAALRAGAGRVYVGLLGDADTVPAVDPGQPALMLRTARAALQSPLVEQAVVVAGCGGGRAMADALPPLLARAPRLVLDADALNALGAAAAA
ncbi:NAD(P)H-hydrate epimerase, partial [Tepidimonas sp.]|uniref:NAD(P)H-hydrate epimerase n=1 Tax=Tepidimonas sp. TaxID=2002775 RepID=UPI0028CF4974